MSDGSWEIFVRTHFPGYLLPNSRVEPISAEEAARFLERITGRQHALELLRAVATLAPRIKELRVFATELLPDLARHLPSRTEIIARDWRGAFHGRLDVQRTLAHRASGDPARFSTTTRQRSFALPENVLVRAIAERLLGVLVDLRQANVLEEDGWSIDARGCEGELRRLLATTELRNVPLEPVMAAHEQAARAAGHPAYHAALEWHTALRTGLDADDPDNIAAVLAAGALMPLKNHKRFEVAVLIRLIQALWAKLQQVGDGGWAFFRCIVRKDRDEVASFEHSSGARVRVYYDQALLDAGACEDSARHYLAQHGRMRPDVTVVVEKGDMKRAAVIEIKHSERPDYILSGLHEAMLYRWEYAAQLHGWPKAILVASSNVPGAPRKTDDVIAVGWKDWVPDIAVDGLLEGVLG